MSTNIHKIIPIADLAEKSAALKKKGKVVAQCHGVFDLMHPGHIKHLEAARKAADVLVVTLTPDRFVNKGPGRPVFNEHLRAESLAALTCVDYVAINGWPTAVEAINLVKPGLYVKGSDYAAPEQDITGGIVHEREAVEKWGGRLHFTDEVTFSSTELLNNFFSVFPPQTKEFLAGFKARHPASGVIDAMKGLGGMKVLVIGDTIIDEYHYCRGLGKSPKENIICTKYVSQETFAGGVLACANHTAGFVKEAKVVTCLGAEDDKRDYVLSRLKPNISPELFTRHDAPTVTKRRFVDPAFLNKLFEVQFFNDYPLPADVSGQVCGYLEDAVPQYDMVLVSDFGHGFIDDKIVEVLCRKARFLAVNTQTNSANLGYNLITKYPKADYICIDEPEMRYAARDKYGDIRAAIERIAGGMNCGKVAVTRGHLGAVTYDKATGFTEIPIFSDKIVDRVGAGDAFLSVSAPLAAAGLPMDVVGLVGNLAGAMKVSIVCNRSSIEPVPLYKFVTTVLK
ncbi:MAG: PfkB family carbohydrate kinase [Elusimicrobiales bacterium]|nr:PfkB family carbohydrate kinase [Elusimicrobiales bacterium]